jgi:hypothetical protein
MAGHVNKACAQIAQIEIGKTDVNCDPAPLFFRQTIRIDSGQGAYQGRLAVVDVTSRADDD